MISNIVFAGTPEISSKLLKSIIDEGYQIALCCSQPDRPKGRNKIIEYTPVKQVAMAHNIPIMQPISLNNPHIIQTLTDLRPDLMIVFAYGLILPKKILDIPKLGCINIHTSLLPRWRGAAPIQHAILAGDEITGITIIQMDPGLDTGNILHTMTCKIDPKETTASLYLKMETLAKTAVLKVLRSLESNNMIQSIPQNHQLATYSNKINKEDAKINWKNSAMEIDRFIRALIPKPVACTKLYQSNLLKNFNKSISIDIRIWQATTLDIFSNTKYQDIINNIKKNNDQNQDPAGTIVQISKLGIDVLTGNNLHNQSIIRLEKIQLPGSKILTIQDLLNAKKYQSIFQVGNKFANL